MTLNPFTHSPKSGSYDSTKCLNYSVIFNVFLIVLYLISFQHIELAKLFETYVNNDARFEVAAPVAMGLVCFRLKVMHFIRYHLNYQLLY